MIFQITTLFVTDIGFDYIAPDPTGDDLTSFFEKMCIRDRFKASAQLSAEQAKRDAGLAFRQEIGAELTKLLAQDTHKALDDKALAALITAALQGEDASAYAAEVASVTDALKSELAGELKAGLELRLSKKVRTGFRLCAKDGSGYIDCSDEELAEQLAPFFRELRI